MDDAALRVDNMSCQVSVNVGNKAEYSASDAPRMRLREGIPVRKKYTNAKIASSVSKILAMDCHPIV